MKTFHFSKVISILLILISTNLHTFSQGSDYPISNHEVIIGDTCILRQESGYCDPGLTYAILSPNNLNWPDNCPECRPDTFLSFRTEIVPNLDTAFYFYFILPMGTLSGSYDAISLCSGTPIRNVGINVYTPPYIRHQPSDTTVCAGDDARFSVTAYGNRYEDLLYKWYHDDSLISSTTESELSIKSAVASDTGVYYCVISNQYGIDTTQTVFLDLHPFPAHPGLPSGPDKFCGYVDTSTYTIPSDPLATGYNWHLEPAVAGDTLHKDTVCSIVWDPAFSGIAKLYVDLLSGNCGRNTSDTLEITVPGFSAAPEICIVGIDEQSGKYRIVWEKSAYGSAQLFRIYRESNQADVYLEIGTVDTVGLSFFVDSSSAPEVLSHRYKISYLDSCGLESEISQFHQTMHLVTNIGINGEVNLSWSEYGGIAFPTYTIYRGAHPDSMSLLYQMPSTVSSYKDIDPPIGKVYYQIGMSNPDGCDPVKKSESDYSSSMSNMDQVLVTGVREANESKPFIIFPNPVTDILQIRHNNMHTRSFQYIIYNPLGKAVLQDHITSNETSLDVSSLLPGIYVLQMLNDSEIHSMRFVIRRK